MSRDDIPDIAGRARADTFRAGAEIAPLVQAEVQPVDLVPGRTQKRHQDSPEVAAITCDEYLHAATHQILNTHREVSPPVISGDLPRPGVIPVRDDLLTTG